VAEEGELLAVGELAGLSDDGADVLDRVVHAVEDAAFAARVAVAAVVEGDRDVVGLVQASRDVRVTVGVLADPVEDDHDADRRTFGQPALPGDIRTASPCEAIHSRKPTVAGGFRRSRGLWLARGTG
jgi:hypothetical protein